MAKLDKKTPVNLQELVVSSLAMSDALAKLLIEKGLITREEFMQKISRGTGDVSKAFSIRRSNEVRSWRPALLRGRNESVYVG
jgi:hypothetical protein